MEKNIPLHLQEIIFATSDLAESKRLSKLVKEGAIRKIASKIYTPNFNDAPETIVKRNLFMILGRLYPKAVISHRSAFEFAPTNSGDIFLTYTYTKNISLPGVTVHLMEGKAGLDEDVPFIEGLYASQRERAFLENMQVSRKSGAVSKTLPRKEIEDKLEQFIRVNGNDAVNALRDKARELSKLLDMEDEFEKLSNIISALLSTRSSDILTSPLAAARAFGFPYDPNRIELFNTLYTLLLKTDFEPLPDKNSSDIAYRNFAFFESYFSNYIEGTRFEIDEAKKIIETGKPMPARNDDSHDVLGTYYIVSNRTEMSITPTSPDELIKILQYRHRVMLAARTSKMPGEFKDKNNFAGDTTFVDFNLVKGTLIKGFDYYNTLTSAFAKAIFMMFMTSEIHPFLDGNGRIARVMMNAELSKAGESKIIIPNVFRDDYLLALRKLTRQGEPEIFVRAMQRVHKFSALIHGEDFSQMREFLNSTNAFSDSSETVLKF